MTRKADGDSSRLHGSTVFYFNLSVSYQAGAVYVSATPPAQCKDIKTNGAESSSEVYDDFVNKSPSLNNKLRHAIAMPYWINIVTSHHVQEAEHSRSP